MPELPEVETIRQDLLPLVRGRTIVETEVSPDAPRLVQCLPAGRQGRQAADDLCRGLVGQRIEDISRRGKYLLFRLSDGRTWIVHLRMTGALLHRPQGCDDERYLRARFCLDDGAWLCYTDLRKLGMMWLVEDESQVVGKLGPEPLPVLSRSPERSEGAAEGGEGFGPAEMRSLLSRRSAPVKAVLMDQEAIAGIGNIYADEALFEARIHPKRSANSLSKREAERLHRAIGQTLVGAMGDRGSSFGNYVDASGEKGSHQFHVRVFRRSGEPCYDCGSLIQRIKVAGRSTHFCPKCQA